MMKIQMKGISLMIILLMLALTVQAAVLRGTITDKATKERCRNDKYSNL